MGRAFGRAPFVLGAFLVVLLSGLIPASPRRSLAVVRTSRASTRRAVPAAFLLFAAALLVVGPAEASRTTNARSSLTPISALSLASSSTHELASLELSLLESVESSPRLAFAEDLSLLDVEARPCGFELFGGVGTSRCALTYARNNPLKYVDPDGRAIRVATNYAAHAKLRDDVASTLLDSPVPGREVLAGAAEMMLSEYAPENRDESRAMLDNAVMSMANPIGMAAGPARSQLHHIMTDKSIKSGFTAVFSRIVAKAGFTLQHGENLLSLVGHSGRHAKEYHNWVTDRLQGATKGLKGEAYKDALIKELRAIRETLQKNPDIVKGDTLK